MEEKLKQLGFFVTLIGALLLVIAIFSPFAAATEDYKEYLQSYPDEMYAKEINMTNKDAVNISLFEFGRMYAAAAQEDIMKEIAIFYLVIILVFALFVILTLLFSVLRKPIAAIIFNLLSLGVFHLMVWDFEDRGLISGNRYTQGISSIICYIGTAIVMVGAIVLLIAKIKLKKAHKSIQASDVKNEREDF